MYILWSRIYISAVLQFSGWTDIKISKGMNERMEGSRGGGVEVEGRERERKRKPHRTNENVAW